MESCYTPFALAQAYFDPFRLSEACEYLMNSVTAPPALEVIPFLKAFAATVLLEAPFYFVATRRESWPRKFRILFLANLATHPAVFFLIPWLFSALGASTRDFVLSAEGFAILTEAILLWKLWKVPAREAFPIALIANLASWWIGIYLVYG